MQRALFVVFSTWFAVSLYAASATEELQSKLNAIANMRADFKQVITAGKKEISSSTGLMALSRPGRFRWQTKNPDPQIIVADGKKLWIYDVDLEQVTVKKQEKGIGGTPALFLSAANDTVSRNFNVIKLEKEKNASPALESFDLHAKSPQENYQEVVLRFKDKELSEIEFFDQLGQHTQVRLNHIQSNTALKEALFQFTPPKGVDIVRQ